MKKNVIITRSDRDNLVLASEIFALNLNPISSPMITHKIIACDFSKFKLYKNIIITSKFAAQIVSENYPYEVAADVVGDESAEILRGNKKIHVRGVYDNLASLLYVNRNTVSDIGQYNALYLSGNHITEAIPFAHRHIIYNTEYATSISTEAMNVISQNRADFVIFYSKNTAQNFIDLIKPDIHLQNLQNSVVIAISEEVGNVVKQYVKDVLCPEKPSSAEMLKLLVQ